MNILITSAGQRVSLVRSFQTELKKIFENTRKPELKFYQTAIEKLEIEASEILYIGDSLKLDIIPAKKLGMNTLLIDRDNIYPNSEKRISSFKELKKYI